MKALLALILAATLSSATLSATISFPNSPVFAAGDLEHGFVEKNFVDTGFRFSPSCILDFLYAITSRGFELCNDNYLGPIGGDFSALYIADSPSSGASNFVVSIPEPATLALIGIALVGLAFTRRRAMSIA